jgi:hypothetical protein
MSAGGTDFGDQRFRLFACVAVMNDDAGAGEGQRAGGGATDAARRAGDEGSSADKIGHGCSPV